MNHLSAIHAVNRNVCYVSIIALANAIAYTTCVFKLEDDDTPNNSAICKSVINCFATISIIYICPLMKGRLALVCIWVGDDDYDAEGDRHDVDADVSAKHTQLLELSF